MGRNCQGTKGTPSRPSKNQALGRFLWYLSISRWFPLEMTGDSTQPPINNVFVTIKSREGRGWRREPRCLDRTSSHTHIFSIIQEPYEHTHAGQALAWIRGGEMRSRMVLLGSRKRADKRVAMGWWSASSCGCPRSVLLLPPPLSTEEIKELCSRSKRGEEKVI